MRISNRLYWPIKIVIIDLVLSCLNGCTLGNQVWEPSASEGVSVKAAIRTQSKYPDGRPHVEPLAGMDGVSAKASMDNYQKSFLFPGAATSSGSSAAAPTSSAPSASGVPSMPITPPTGPTAF